MHRRSQVSADTRMRGPRTDLRSEKKGNGQWWAREKKFPFQIEKKCFFREQGIGNAQERLGNPDKLRGN